MDIIADQDNILNALDHPLIHVPATISIVGLAVWTAVMWGWQRKRYKEGGWWHDYKDEFLVSLLGCMTFVVYDSQLVHLYNIGAAFILTLFGNPVESSEMSSTLTFEHYLACGGVCERLYSWGHKIYEKFENHEDSK